MSEKIPEELIVYVVVILHLGRFHKGSQQTRAAIGRSLFQVGVTALHIFAEKFCCPLRLAEIVERSVDVIRQVTLGLAQVFDLRGFAVEAGLEDRVENEVRIRIRSLPSALPRACSSRCRWECGSSIRGPRRMLLIWFGASK